MVMYLSNVSTIQCNVTKELLINDYLKIIIATNFYYLKIVLYNYVRHYQWFEWNIRYETQYENWYLYFDLFNEYR